MGSQPVFERKVGVKPEDQFNKNADDYRDEPLFAEGEDLKWMLGSGALSGTEELLDVGCGAGHAAMAFAPFVRRCVGIDVTAAMVRAATALAAGKGLKNVDFLVGAAEELPLPSGGFDLVTCRFAAHHFENIRAALSQVARVLRPGGAFLLVDHYAPEDQVLDAFINELDRTRDPSHVREYNGVYHHVPTPTGLHSGLPGRLPGPRPKDVEHRERLFVVATAGLPHPNGT